MSSVADPALDERPVPDLVASVWRYRLTVALLATVAALAGAAIHIAFPGQPTATVRVTLQTAGSDLSGTAPLTPAAQATFVANQTAFFHDSRVLARLEHDLHGGYRASALARKIQASAGTTGTIVTVEVTDAEPASAVRIANTLVLAFREVVRARNLIASARAIEDISAAQADLARQLADAFRAGNSAKTTADAIATALAALKVQATQVQVNSTTYDDGVAAWQNATSAHGGRRVPDVRQTLAGLAIGLLLGILVAWMRADRNRQIRTGADASRLLGSPLLAEVPAIAGGLPAPFDPLPVPDERDRRRPRRRSRSRGQEAPAARTADPYFTLASVLASSGPSTVIAVTGATEGSGATTTAIGLAMSAARDGMRVLLVDADPSARTVARAAHIEPGEPGLYEVASGELSAPEAIVGCAVGDGCRLDVLPPGAGSDRYPHALRSPAGRALFGVLAARYDRVIVDTGPLLRSASTVALLPLVDAVVTVVRHGADAELAVAVHGHLELLQARHVGSVFTFSRTATLEAMQG